MGNPHLVCVTDVDVASLDLTTVPDVDGPAFPDGVNVEFVTLVGDAPCVDARARAAARAKRSHAAVVRARSGPRWS